MDKTTRNSIQRATQKARMLLEDAYREQLEGTFDILLDGTVAPHPGTHLTPAQRVTREKLVATIAHKRSTGLKAREAVDAYSREAAFTTLNRFVALKMLEARDLVQECVSKGEDSSGFKEFTALAPGLVSLEDKGYRLYLQSLFDEIGQEVKVLFDRRDVASLLWPDRQTLLELLRVLNEPEIAGVWGEDETIGWVYQYFNGDDERTLMRAESQAPRNSRELAVRNQFFTPRYVVQFLADNTLGRTWYEMMQGDTKLARLEYFVQRSNEVFLADGDSPPESDIEEHELTPDDAYRQKTFVPFRTKKDPRDLGVLDPACGSGHFLLYAFDLLLAIYEEAWADAGAAAFTKTGTRLRDNYGSLEDLRRATPELILRHNLHGVDIDPRAAQIAALALWMRAQKAYNQFGVNRTQRPAITRTNVVVAEPMPVDPHLVEEFASSLEPAVLGDLFRKMVEEMKLAGDLGSLLKIEESIAKAVKEAADKAQQGNLFAGRVVGEEFWDTADEKIIAALGGFAESATGASGIGRQLFVEDAVRGVAFIELMRRRFDAVLMNPPFGQPVAGLFPRLRSDYTGAHNDILASMVRRGRELAPTGRVGAITSRAFLVAKRMESFRGDWFLPAAELLLDLGSGVMDNALVEAAAYVLCGSPSSHDFLATDAREEDSSVPPRWPRPWTAVKPSDLSRLPGKRVLYDLPQGVFRVLASKNRFEPDWGTAREGMKTFDDFRFLRLRWEVPSEEVGWDKTWRTYAKGGEFSFYLLDLPLVLKWDRTGDELQAVNLAANGSTSQVRQASSYWGQSGATYSRRSAAGFSARALPAETVFSTKGPAVLPTSFGDEAELLGWLNSRLVRTLIHLQANASDFMTGILKSLPFADFSRQELDEVGSRTREALRLLVQRRSVDETSPFFVAPAAPSGLTTVPEHLIKAKELAGGSIETSVEAIDQLVDEAYGVDSSQWSSYCQVPEIKTPVYTVDGEDEQALLSWGVGLAFGRFGWPIQPFGGEQEAAPFDSVPPRSRAEEAPSLGIPYAILTSEGHQQHSLGVEKESIGRAAVASLKLVGFDRALVDTCSAALGKSVASWFARDFFDWHLGRYSTSRRKAPIYWQLATPSASYAVWCYYHGLTRDTFFQIGNDYVAPKLDHEERKLNALRQDAGPSPGGQQRKKIESQEAFVAELRALLAEVRRIAPLWNPNPNDGVVINFAPLWRLVPHHSSWQKECKQVWDKLCKGDYDWAHLAIHLWPERVVPKCTKDRSLASAHGLEEEFWYETGDGKWKARTDARDKIDELVAARSSTAVKAALDSLLTAPTPSGTTRRRGRRRGGA